jgi:rod shape-determining protein MreC
MVRKQIRISKGLVFTWLTLGGLICLFLPQSLTSRINLAFLSVYKYAPVPAGGSIPLASVTNTSADETISKDYQQLKSQYIQLQNHRDNLWAELASEHRQNEHLAGIRTRFPSLSGAKFISAEVITSPSGARTSEIIINRGSTDGVRKDQFVLGDNSVIGKIADVSARTAVIRLISDKGSLVPVEVAGSKVARVMRGDGKGFARIKMVPKKYHIEKGAAVYTCKAPGFLDVPLVVGKVQSYRADDDNPLLWDIFVKPTSEIESLTGVDVVVMNP